LAGYTENSSDAFRPAAAGRRGEAPEKLAASPRSFVKTAKEPEKYRLEPHFTKPPIDF